jgi:hypothetical protein
MAAIFPASTKGGGNLFAMPDVCKTPAPPSPSPVPVPYPNIAMLSQAADTSSKVKFKGKEAFTMKSKVSRSSGDEAGTLKGMMSQKNMDEAKPSTGVSKVLIEGAQAVRHLTPFKQNGSSANSPAGTQVAPSQTSVKVAP